MLSNTSTYMLCVQNCQCNAIHKYMWIPATCCSLTAQPSRCKTTPQHAPRWPHPSSWT
jgi:hypothetical protein